MSAAPQPLQLDRAPSRHQSWWWRLSRDRGWWLDGLLLAALLVLAAGLRLDRLLLAPAFTDESMEVQLALDVLASGRPNLVGTIPYIGGLHTWLLLAASALTDSALAAPRWLSLVAGLGTVLLTYGLGRQLGGRWAGLLAGGLLATNLAHATLNSRIAWSNCLTPLWLTAGLLVLLRALRHDQPRWLPLAGLLLALALQTHPTVVTVLPGLALGLLLDRTVWRWLCTPWPWLGLLAAVVGYANVLWFNLITGGRAVSDAQELSYAVRPASDLGQWLASLSELGAQLLRTIGSAFVPASPTPTYPLTLTALGVVALAVAGSLVGRRPGRWLLPLTILSGMALLAAIGGEYQPLPHGSARYVAPLWPPLYALAGLGLVTLVSRLAGPAPASDRPGRRRGLAAASGVAVGLLLVAPPAVTTRRYLDWYLDQPLIGSFNAFAVTMTELVAARYPGQRVYLDTSLHNDLSSDAGTMHRSLSMLLRLAGNRPVTLRRAQQQSLRLVWEQLGGAPGPVILRRDHTIIIRRDGGLLTPVGDVTRVLNPQVGEFRLYELRLTAASGGA